MAKKKKSEPAPISILLKHAWLKLCEQATRGAANVESHLHWGGVPNDDNDPLMLAGMELRLAWREVGAPKESGLVVSLITLEKFLGSYVDPGNSAVTWNDYEVEIAQATDPGSHYHQLLSNQRKMGIDPESIAPVTVQKYRARIFVGPVQEAYRKHFWQRFKVTPPNPTLRDGILFKQLGTTVDEIGNFPTGNFPTSRRRRSYDGVYNLTDEMSDLVIDRVFELQAMIAEWLCDRKGNKEKRLKRLAKVKLELETVLAQERDLNEKIELACQSINLKFQEIDQYQAQLTQIRSENKVETPDSLTIELERSIADTESSIRALENEIPLLTKDCALIVRRWGVVSPKFIEAKAKEDAAKVKLAELKALVVSQKHRFQQRGEELLRLEIAEEERIVVDHNKVVDEIETLNAEVEKLQASLETVKLALVAANYPMEEFK